MSSRDEVALALSRLNDALCSHERDSGGGCTLVLVPHDSGKLVHVSVDGRSVGLPSTKWQDEFVEHVVSHVREAFDECMRDANYVAYLNEQGDGYVTYLNEQINNT